MRTIDVDVLEKAKFHPLPYTHIVPKDADAESYKRGWNDAIDAVIENEPTVSAPQWIPCSERLPEDDTLMLVNYVDNRPEAIDIWIGWHEMENVWYIDGEVHSKEYGNEVIAWMPLPKPYKEGEKNADY